jgi:cyclohexanone monooxygenase
MRSLHGIHVHGFPNAFLVQLGQGGTFVANVPHNFTDAAKNIAAVVSHMASHGFDVVDATRQAEDAWMKQLVPNPVITSFLAECTPGYYNNEGQGQGAWSLLTGYQYGPPAYFRYSDQWRSSGDFAGLEFSKPGSAATGPAE